MPPTDGDGIVFQAMQIADTSSMWFSQHTTHAAPHSPQTRPGLTLVPARADAAPGARASVAVASPRLVPYLVLGTVWCVMALLVNPAGNFPLNDDWSYGRAVQSLVERGELRFTGWTSMPLVIQVLWGALFCLPFGFSFTALRLSTLTLGLVGVLATYELLREAGANRGLAFVGALLVAVNPIYYALSHTFMTDVPFTSLALLAFLCFVRAMRTGHTNMVVAGTLLATMATLVRQLGVVIPVAFAVALLATRGISARNLRVALIPVGLVAAALVVYTSWLGATHGLPALYSAKSDELLSHLTSGSLSVIVGLTARMAVATIYVGLFVLPLAAFAALCPRITGSRLTTGVTWTVGVLVPLATLVLLTLGRVHVPLLGNVLFEGGVGPAALRDTYILKLQHLPTAPAWGVHAAFALGVAGVGLVAVMLVRSFAADRREGDACRHGPLLMVITAGLLFFVPVGLARIFDRYLLLLIPLVMVAVVTTIAGVSGGSRPRLGYAIAAAFVVVCGGFSVGATHDYLSWNRARWRAADFLVTENRISPRRIDGGFEFNGWLNYAAEQPGLTTPAGASSRQPSAPSNDASEKSWWWVADDEYVIAFGAIPGYGEVRSFSYDRWLPPGEGRVVALRRSGRAR